ncbi:MAG: hypothetical protein J7L88_06285, partial [Thermoplasmata archaeon]|nr:hypothetical protein [Thermoplasmata archaeon]
MMVNKIKKICSYIALLLVTVSLLAPIFPHPVELSAGVREKLNAYTTHNPIRVDNDAELAAVATSGSGTFLDPYIIEGYLIKGDGAGAGIYIGNTSKYFIIRNCLIQDTTRDHPGAGIHLYKVDNGGISNVVLED